MGIYARLEFRTLNFTMEPGKLNEQTEQRFPRKAVAVGQKRAYDHEKEFNDAVQLRSDASKKYLQRKLEVPVDPDGNYEEPSDERHSSTDSESMSEGEEEKEKEGPLRDETEQEKALNKKYTELYGDSKQERRVQAIVQKGLDTKKANNAKKQKTVMYKKNLVEAVVTQVDEYADYPYIVAEMKRHERNRDSGLFYSLMSEIGRFGAKEVEENRKTLALQLQVRQHDEEANERELRADEETFGGALPLPAEVALPLPAETILQRHPSLVDAIAKGNKDLKDETDKQRADNQAWVEREIAREREKAQVAADAVHATVARSLEKRDAHNRVLCAAVANRRAPVRPNAKRRDPIRQTARDYVPSDAPKPAARDGAPSVAPKPAAAALKRPIKFVPRQRP